MIRAMLCVPTRRSSDLEAGAGGGQQRAVGGGRAGSVEGRRLGLGSRLPAAAGDSALLRSEEHTSELQSHVNLVCRLLLEKNNHTLADDRSDPFYDNPNG